MTKEELALKIVRSMNKGQSQVESFNSYQCIKGYFLDLREEDLVGIANHYGINLIDFNLT
mgnify:FL=1|tara:strand:+ start:410 stop:589 length:180 start_codon:yes stop_codon:yes gene_type:complete